MERLYNKCFKVAYTHARTGGDLTVETLNSYKNFNIFSENSWTYLCI